MQVILCSGKFGVSIYDNFHCTYINLRIWLQQHQTTTQMLQDTSHPFLKSGTTHTSDEWWSNQLHTSGTRTNRTAQITHKNNMELCLTMTVTDTLLLHKDTSVLGGANTSL